MSRKIILLLLFSFLLQGCSKYSIEPPAGFAAMKKNSNTYYYSPDGIKIKVSVFSNKPQRDREFWNNALKNHLSKKGYVYLEDSSSGNENNVNTDYWLLSYGRDYYIYMTSVFTSSRYIVTAEAAGEKKLFEKYRDVIEDSLSTLKLR